MTLINWSDPEEMVGLLTEFVADERRERVDEAREAFLSDLLEELAQWSGEFATISTDQAIEKLRVIRDSLDQEFSEDPVVVHLEACIEELKRIRMNELTDSKSARGSGS